ncbi:C4-dicarboxylate ABC transporter permease [Oceanobacillus sp. E9]|uniref:C4-dicarboxylate ABC transporter permease n=1 Tax=Oceanobacillus kimchii TaxID=746691 RepID=A0ABQ5TMD0_9BACI|nr:MULTISPECIES: TRAP transporter small permease [Oceanobacillus]MBT2599740.1 TRAP transporter small permease [Oceanobacillus sp. ISL-74]OEH56283.1 C4-dicarboxylate ABC transporter permease [Oceanobacillus sp. E9]GLO67968.1 C4-dicarboxylate ABC transporter permease [Oceanobacillus kimchii]
MKTYINIMDSINNWVKYLVSFFLVALAVLVVLQVTTRFVINVPLSWTEELAKYLMIYIVFLGSGLAMRHNQHIAIDFLLEIVKAENKARLQKIVLCICGIFSLVLVVYGTQLTYIVIGQSTPTLQYSMAWAYAAIPLGSLLMLCNVIALLMSPLEDDDAKETVGDIL